MGEEYNMTGDELMSKLTQDLFKLYEVPQWSMLVYQINKLQLIKMVARIEEN